MLGASESSSDSEASPKTIPQTTLGVDGSIFLARKRKSGFPQLAQCTEDNNMVSCFSLNKTDVVYSSAPFHTDS